MSNIIFDFDGTLFDTYPGISKSIKLMMSDMGLKALPESEYAKFIGPPVHIGFHDFLGLSGDELERAVELFRKYYTNSGVYDSRPYDGIEEMLQELKANGATLGIASSKPEFAVTKLLKLFKLDTLFDKVSAASGVERSCDKSERLLLAASEPKAAMVGDRLYDMQAAKKVGFTAVGVSYGFGTRQELFDFGADFVCDTVKELKSTLITYIEETTK